MKVGKFPLLLNILFRLNKSRYSPTVVVATSELEQDDVISEFCQKHHCNCFRGDETNVLKRFMKCADEYNFDHIVRVTADNPFIDVEEMDNLIDVHLENNNDYTHSFGELPLGLGTEIFAYNALKSSYMFAREPHHKEHVNEFIIENPNKYKVQQIHVPENKQKPELRLTVDTQEDYEKACNILLNNAFNTHITTIELIKYCSHSA